MKNAQTLAVLLVTLATIVSVIGSRATDPPADLPIHTETTEPVETATTAPTTTTAAPAPVLCYPLTGEERDLVERVVMAEAGGEAHEGQLAVAQCILNACLLDGIRPAQVVEEYSYTDNRPEPTEQVKVAVAAVFDDGLTVFDPDVLYFYAPELCRSDWHETQDYVTTIGCHRFFKEAK